MKKQEYLSPEVEKLLLAEYFVTKDIKIRDKLLDSMMGMIVKQARSCTKDRCMQEDLINEGVIAFIGALNAFKPDYNYRLITFCSLATIRQMLRYLKNTESVLTVGRGDDVLKIANRLRNEDTLSWTHSNVVEFCSKHSVTYDMVLDMLNCKESRLEYLDVFSPSFITPESLASYEELDGIVKQLILALPSYDDSQSVYGLLFEDKSYVEIAKAFGIKVSWVRQKYLKQIRDIRSKVKEQLCPEL